MKRQRQSQVGKTVTEHQRDHRGLKLTPTKDSNQEQNTPQRQRNATAAMKCNGAENLQQVRQCQCQCQTENLDTGTVRTERQLLYRTARSMRAIDL
mmetsp:Transcript_19489/g.41012  ORF Transcript_19489/g.41012 Transcript_19489/m.41012 type:complete len:96 (-) Transcript_19489:138-425(-)